MKNRIYLCCLLIDNQANVDIDIYETNNTIIPKEENLIPETVINQKINIDMDLLSNSKLLFVGCYAIVCVVLGFIFIRYNNEDADDILENILNNYTNDDNNRLGTLSLFLQLIIILILSYIVIVNKNINKYISKYIFKINSLFKSWCLYMLLILIYLLIVTKGCTDFKHKGINSTETMAMRFKDILTIFNIFGQTTFTISDNYATCYYATHHYAPFILFVRSIISTFIINNIILITSYYMLKGYYHLRPMKYKEKRDYINTLNNNITPVNVLDNNLIVENNII